MKPIGERDDEIDWDSAMTLEDVIRKLIREGREEEVVPILRILPPEKKEKYRKIWKDEKERGNGLVDQES